MPSHPTFAAPRRRALRSRPGAAILLALLGSLAAACWANDVPSAPRPDDGAPAAVADAAAPSGDEALATFAGGCFWCMEKPFEDLPGVRAVISGYAGGSEPGPTYEQVSSGRTGHAESVQIHYDPTVISYDDLLEVYWRQVDPTDAGGQFVDRGSQYRPAIFVHDAAQRASAERSKQVLAESGRFDAPIVVEITDYDGFWPAEDYHQDFYRKSPVRYHSYRAGSGRDRFLERAWGEDRGYTPKGPAAGTAAPASTATAPAPFDPDTYVRPSEAELAARLPELAFAVTRKGATEPPFRNAFWDEHAAGIYVDVVSGEPLFSSRDKFESGTGWPSFTKPLVPENVVEHADRSHFMVRTEVRSKHADSHLGHVFTDGPPPTGLRYCINSAALRFVPAAELEEAGYGRFAEGL